MKVAPSPVRRSESDGRPRRRSPIAAVLPVLLTLAGLALANSPAAAEPAPATDSADGTAGLVPAALLLVVAGVVAVVARRVTGPHAD
ncbi:hypothetical protein [Agromyces sp. ZXT2-6]|uniref:hypothetical protein n=1 Tax=Agromyces sp. ZXT2-6 TaxID=3461153 RepID=UPI0040550C32